MADPFKILSAGDSVKAGDGPFNSTWHNAVSDATRASLRDAVPSTAPIRPIEVPRDSEIWIANCSEANVDQFTAIGLGQLAIPPDGAGDFRERLCFLSAALAAGQPFGIVQDAIGPGELYVCKTASGPGGQPPRSGWIRVKGDAAAWSSATTYAIGQQVTYDGETWIAKAASTNQAPASGSYWQISGAHRGIWDRDETYTPSDVVLLPQLGRIHIAGVSRAYLNIRNTEHAYAGIESGELVSQRAPGPIAILWRGGIGNNWAVVRFCCDDTLTTPDVTGTGALDLGALVPAATCTYLYTPGGAPEFGAVTVAGTGTYTPPAFTGSGAMTLGAAESDAVSLAYDVPPSGRLNLGALTADGEGEVTTPPRGRCRLRLGALEAAGVGAVTFPAFSGSGAMTLGAVYVEHAHAHINRVVSINGGTKEQQFIAVDSAIAGADLNVTTAATAYDSLKVYYQGQVATSAGSTYRYINATPGDGVLLSNTSYWEDITGKGLIVINVPQGTFTALSGDFTHNAKPGETIVVSTVGGTAGNSIINLPADTDSNAYGYETGRPGAEVVIKYVEWSAGTYLKITGACIYDSADSDPYQPLTIHGDSGYTPGTDFLEPSAMVFRWTQSYSHAPVCRWILAASHNLIREDGLHAGRIYYTRPPGASATTAGLTFRRGFYAGGTVNVGAAEGGTGINTSGVTDGQIIIGKASDHSWNLATLTPGSGITITNGAGSITIAASGGGGLSDGNYGDVTVGSSGTTMTINANAVTYAKMQDVSATSRILGRKTSGAGDPEECTLSEVLDFVGSAAQGDILHRGASAWARLAAPSSAAGLQLRSGGTGTNPGWVDGHGPSMVQNLNLYATATAGALTIEVKTNGGTDPTSTDYCVIPFRSVGTSVGFEKYRHITGAKTLTIPSGATLGAANGTPFRVWVGAVDSMVDALPETGTIQLFAINCYDGASTIYPLRDNEMANPTAIGTGSDSSGVMYSPATVSGAARAIRILGYFEWPSGLTTAGTWTFASTDIAQLYHPGVPLPGEVIQQAGYTDSAVATGSTAIPFDNTKPQNTEGVQYFSQAITVQSAANVMEIDAKAIGCASGAEFLAMALFRDSGADALRTTMCTVNYANWANQMHLAHRVIAGSVGSTTWKIRIGGETNVYTWTLNGQSGSGFFNSTFDSHLFVREIMT